MKERPTKKTLTITLDWELYEFFVNYAKAERVPMTSILRTYILSLKRAHESEGKLLIVGNEKTTDEPPQTCQICGERPGQTVSEYGEKKWVCYGCQNEQELLSGNKHRPVRY